VIGGTRSISRAWSATPRKEIAAANNIAIWIAELMCISQLCRNLVNPRSVDAKALICCQGLAGKLEKDPFKGGSSH